MVLTAVINARQTKFKLFQGVPITFSTIPVQVFKFPVIARETQFESAIDFEFPVWSDASLPRLVRSPITSLCASGFVPPASLRFALFAAR